MLKLVSSRLYLDLRSSVEALRRENGQLRERLAAAQKARETSDKTAELLRKEKERLRLKLGDAKRASDQQRRMNDQLGEKIAQLREENLALRNAARLLRGDSEPPE